MGVIFEVLDMAITAPKFVIRKTLCDRDAYLGFPAHLFLLWIGLRKGDKEYV